MFAGKWGHLFSSKRESDTIDTLETIATLQVRNTNLEARIRRLEKEYDALVYKVSNPSPTEIVTIPLDQFRPHHLITSEEIVTAWNRERSRWSFFKDGEDVALNRLYRDGVLVGHHSKAQCQKQINLACGEAARQLMLKRSI